MASVTYGNAKQADVVAFYGGRAVTLEVKSTSEPKWVLGGEIPPATDIFWVLVFLPPAPALPPEYYVLSANELRSIVLPAHLEYAERYRLKHGKKFTGGGVVSVHRVQVLAALGAWDKVLEAIGI